MKRTFTILVLIILAAINLMANDTLKSGTAPKEISINEAIEKGLLEMTICGSFDPREFVEILDRDGVHFGKCMAIILKSKIDSLVLLRLDCGTFLMPTDTSVQRMLVTHKAIFPLYPNQTYATRFYAMCSQIHHSIPTVGVAFKIGEMADSGLVKLAKYIESTYMQNMVGQHAVWAYTDQANFEELKKYGADSITISKTKEILNTLNLDTKLNPKAIVKNETIEASNISINRYLVYSGLGIIVLLTIATIALMFRKKKKDDIIV